MKFNGYWPVFIAGFAAIAAAEALTCLVSALWQNMLLLFPLMAACGIPLGICVTRGANGLLKFACALAVFSVIPVFLNCGNWHQLAGMRAVTVAKLSDIIENPAGYSNAAVFYLKDALPSADKVGTYESSDEDGTSYLRVFPLVGGGRGTSGAIAVWAVCQENWFNDSNTLRHFLEKWAGEKACVRVEAYDYDGYRKAVDDAVGIYKLKTPAHPMIVRLAVSAEEDLLKRKVFMLVSVAAFPIIWFAVMMVAGAVILFRRSAI